MMLTNLLKRQSKIDIDSAEYEALRQHVFTFMRAQFETAHINLNRDRDIDDASADANERDLCLDMLSLFACMIEDASTTCLSLIEVEFINNKLNANDE
jgi:hypothetical protein